MSVGIPDWAPPRDRVSRAGSGGSAPVQRADPIFSAGFSAAQNPGNGVFGGLRTPAARGLIARAAWHV